jgi:hypothetical protein
LRQRLFGPSQQEPKPAQADRWNIAPLLPPLVLARRVELARNEQAAPQTDLLCRLPALPLDLWPAGVKPSPAALLLAVCTVAAMDDPSSSPAAAHIDHLSALISVSLSRPDAAGQMSKIGHWLEQRLATAQWRVAARGAHDLISALQSGGSFAARHPDVRRRLEEGIDALCPADDTRRVLATRLGSVLLSGRGPIDFDADTEAQPPDEWLIPSMFPVALEVVAIFQAALRGQVDERLAARIAIVREVMARPDAARALDRVSFLQVHDIMCSADDPAFDAAIQYVRGSVAS